MAQLGNHLVYDLLELADVLAEQSAGRSDLLKVRRRRAVSNAYYALFHALSYICVDALLGWDIRDHLQEPLYRTLDHAVAKKRLASPDARAMAPVLVRAAFANLQENRHRADYGSPALEFSAPQVSDLIDQAKQSIIELESLTSLERRPLAILLIAKPR